LALIALWFGATEDAIAVGGLIALTRLFYSSGLPKRRVLLED